MTAPSNVASLACLLITERDIAGQSKYGVSMDRQDLKPSQWLQHAIEEHADALQYQLKLGLVLEGVVREAYLLGQNSVYRTVSPDGCIGRVDNDPAIVDKIVRDLLG